MTRMTGPDCAVMCNLINTHTHTHTHTNTHTYRETEKGKARHISGREKMKLHIYLVDSLMGSHI